MGDRFYTQQKQYKPKRRLKAEVIAELHELLGAQIQGLDKLTIKTLDELIHQLKVRDAFAASVNKFSNTYRELEK